MSGDIVRDAEDLVMDAIWKGEGTYGNISLAYRRHIASQAVEELLRDPRLLAKLAIFAENRYKDERTD